MRLARGSLKGGPGAGARTEVSERESRGTVLFPQPGRCEEQPVGKQIDIEYLAAIVRLIRLQEIQKKRGKASSLQVASDELVAGTQSSAAAAMGKGDHALGPVGQSQ